MQRVYIGKPSLAQAKPTLQIFALRHSLKLRSIDQAAVFDALGRECVG